MDTNLIAILLLLLTPIIDFFPIIRINLFMKKKKIIFKDKDNHFVILVPVFGDKKYLVNLKDLKRYKSKVVLCTTKYESKEFLRALKRLEIKYRFRIRLVDVPVLDGKPIKSSISIFKGAIRRTRAKYVIRIDADSIPSDNLALLFGELSKTNFDIVSTRVLPDPKQQKIGLLYDIQKMEYDISMDSRNIYHYLTSGAAIVGKTSALKEIMKHHSLFFNGEDIEIGKIALKLGYKVGHIPFIVYTEIPDTMKSIIKQRRDWMLGGFRHSIINIHTNIHAPWILFYNSILLYGMLPLRLYVSIVYFWLLPTIYLVYLTYSIIFHIKHISISILFLPIYAFVQATIIPIFSIFYYFKRVKKINNWGIIKLRGVEKKQPKFHFPIRHFFFWNVK